MACGSTPWRVVFKFWRLKSRNNLYYSQDYTRNRCRNSYTVSFEDCKFGTIQYLEVESQNSVVYVFAVVKVLSVQHVLNCTHLFVAKDTGIVKPIPVGSIQSKCVCINVGSELFIGTFPCRFLPMLS